ncbi:MAG: CoA transferase [Armatimonadetes bacterium]|nr:CoA transferase [Armatimonadota bacterium]
MPLSDLQVLDLSRLLPGPYATMILADLGADVVKLESPHKPDYLRFIPPLKDDVNVAFSVLNRGKRSIMVRFDTAEGAAVVRRLASRCDVLVESFRSGYLERFGLDYARLSADNPRLIYASLTAHGQRSTRAGHDLNFLALSGLGAAFRNRNGDPVMPAVQLGDLMGGLSTALAVLAALHERSRTGRGRHLDLSLTDAAYALTVLRSAEQLATGSVKAQQVLAGASPAYRYYRCADGKWLAVGAIEDKFRSLLCQALGCPELAEELLMPGRRAPELHRRLEEMFAGRPRHEWLELLTPLDACIEPVLEPDETLEHEWFVQRHGQVAEPPGLLGAVFPRRSKPVPAPGADTRPVLRGAGFTEDELRTLEEGEHVFPAEA